MTRGPFFVWFLLAFLLSATFQTASAQIAPAPGVADAAEPDPTDREPAAEPVPESLSSPRATMDTFLRAMSDLERARTFSGARAGVLDELRACLDLSGAGNDAAEQAAVEILAVLNRLGKVNVWALPDARDASDLGLTEYVFFPNERLLAHRQLLDEGARGRIVLARGEDGAWRFDRETVQNADDLYRSVEHVGIVTGADERTLSLSLWLRSKMPHSLRENEFAGVELWEWLGLLVIVFIAMVIDYTVQVLLRTVAASRIRRSGDEVNTDMLRRAARPFGLFAGALIGLALLRLLGLPPLAQQIIFTAVRLILMVAGVLAAFRIVDLLLDLVQQRAAMTHTRFDDLLVPLVRKTLKVFVAALGLIYIADSLSIEILPLLTGLGIGGIAVAFAAKDTIENFFGSVAVIFDRPFEVGDWVVVGDVEGTVEQLGFRSTRVRTFYNSLVTVPNASLVRATVDNYGRRKYRRYKGELGLAYDTPPEKIDAFCEGVRELIRHHPYTRKDYYAVHFVSFGAASLNVLLYVFFETPDWSMELRERHRLLNDILRLADKLGVEFAYPTQTLYLKRGAASPGPNEPDYAPTTDREEQSETAGRKLARSITRDAAWRRRDPGPVGFPGAELMEEPQTDDEGDEPDSQVEQRTAGG